MSYRPYSFWEKNRADRASYDAMDARIKKEDVQKRLDNAEKFIQELKSLLEKARDEGKIDAKFYNVIENKIKEL